LELFQIPNFIYHSPYMSYLLYVRVSFCEN